MISSPFLPAYGRVICTILSCIGSGSGCRQLELLFFLFLCDFSHDTIDKFCREVVYVSESTPYMVKLHLQKIVFS